MKRRLYANPELRVMIDHRTDAFVIRLIDDDVGPVANSKQVAAIALSPKQAHRVLCDLPEWVAKNIPPTRAPDPRQPRS